MTRLRVVMLAMQVRTGKTLTSFGIAELVKAQNVLFITKKKVITSGTILKDYNLLNPSFTLEMINYESIHKVNTTNVDLFIIDESHALGAYPRPSLRTKRIKEIVGYKMVILLTGTPTPESWSQIYHQFWISSYSPFSESNFYIWAQNYVNITKRYVSHGNQVNDYSKAKIDLIERKLANYLITYSQQQAGFQTTVSENVLYVQMQPLLTPL